MLKAKICKNVPSSLELLYDVLIYWLFFNERMSYKKTLKKVLCLIYRFSVQTKAIGDKKMVLRADSPAM